MKKFSKEIQGLPCKVDCIRIFTDGSCYPNPGGPGGWAFIIQYQDDRPDFKNYGGVRSTTNNRMELMAVIQALLTLNTKYTVELVTDSEYVGKGIALWMEQWKKIGWKQKNGDLWSQLYDLVNLHKVYVTCIRGHQGQIENEECDRMAELGRKSNV